jgi:protein-S-isoprenylcysteine O-methyltransferase Ste14
MRLLTRPRPANSAPVWLNVLKTLLQVVFMWGTFLWALPNLILMFESYFRIPGFSPQPVPGWTTFILASSVGLPCGLLFAVCGDGTPLPLDTANQLVIRGPYRYIRNPMAAMGILQGIAVGVIVGSFLVVAYAIAGGFVWHFVARPWEEADLGERFGEEYAAYRRAVPLWVPRLTPYREN